MKILSYLCLLLFGLAAAKPSRVGIINGTDVDIAENPWMISVYSNKLGFICSGSLISPNWAITAGHCAILNEQDKIRVGSSSLTDDKGTFVEIAESFVHPNFTFKDDEYLTLLNDIALLRLKSPVNGTNIAPIALPELNAPVPEGQFVNVTGWGDTTGHDTMPDKLQGATIVINPIESCIETFDAIGRTVDKEREFCAGTIDGITGICHGDSGGPAEINGTLIGVTAWTLGGCATNEKPSVFTNVAYYRDWIQKVTGI